MHANTIGDMFFKRHQTNAAKKTPCLSRIEKYNRNLQTLPMIPPHSTFQVDLDIWTLTLTANSNLKTMIIG